MSYYIGVDIGTGSTKAIAFKATADKILHTTQCHYPTLQPYPHYSEQDPELIWTAFTKCIRQLVEYLKESPTAIGISSAMHSLIPVDQSGKPLMNSITWADGRSTVFAEQIKSSSIAKDLYEHTGTPIHAMSPLSKLCWMRTQEPEIFYKTFKFISIKEFIWFKLFGEYEADYSVASASGLFNIHDRRWYSQALEKAGITEDRLSRLVNTTYKRSDISSQLRKELHISTDTEFVIGATDGCLANLGSNAITPGVASLTIGTSGAIRMASPHPCRSFTSMIFNYLLDDKTYIVGGPINNGGAVWKWFITNFITKDADAHDYQRVLKKASEIPAGSDGLIFLPYLMGERAPVWDSKACGTFFGINMKHTEDHFTRAVIEGISFALYSVGKALEEASGHIEYIYASGGFAQSKEWLQIIADIFNKKVYRRNTEDASAIGAALMAIKATQNLSQYPALQSEDIGELIHPDTSTHTQYQQYYPFFQRLYEKLKDEMAAMFYMKNYSN